jgi:hypothetical protein
VASTKKSKRQQLSREKSPHLVAGDPVSTLRAASTMRVPATDVTAEFAEALSRLLPHEKLQQRVKEGLTAMKFELRFVRGKSVLSSKPNYRVRCDYLALAHSSGLYMPTPAEVAGCSAATDRSGTGQWRIVPR